MSEWNCNASISREYDYGYRRIRLKKLKALKLSADRIHARTSNVCRT